MTLVPAEEIWLDLPYETRLSIAEHIFTKINEEPCGSFRRLIYDRLKFETDAYSPLYCAGGMNITNAISEYLEKPGVET